MKKTIIAVLAILCLSACTATPNFTSAEEVKCFASPDGRLSLTFSMTDEGEPCYSLSFAGRRVISDSRLGFDVKHSGGISDMRLFTTDTERQEGFDLSRGFEVKEVAESSADELWTPVWGEQSTIREHYNELAVSLVQKESNRAMTLRFRLFDDGLGFRYEFPLQQELGFFVLREELTEFNMAEDMTTFWIAGDYDANEFQYVTSPITQIPSLYPSFDRSANITINPMPVAGVQTPVMMRSDGLYVNIHEAGLENYPAMQLEVRGRGYRAHLVPDMFGNKGYLQTPMHTPWRTVIVTDNAPAVLESRLILNLNEPCAIEGDLSWIKPRKFMGVWWEMFLPGRGSWAYSDETNVKIDQTDFSALKPNGRHSANTENVKKYIDFASENGIEGLLVEGWNTGWENWCGLWKEHVFDYITPYPDFDLPYLRDYAKSKGVKLIMHHETGGSAANYERYLDRAYQFMADNGYDALKSGYVSEIIPRGEYHYGQAMVNHYLHCVKRAADYHIMVDAHEPVRPTGMHRTYPNYIAAESGRGTEFKNNAPEHTTIIEFTRLMGGPMDYTPGIFEPDMSVYGESDERLHTTIARQLALYVTMYSPLQMAADLPENYARFMDAFQFIKDVAVDWDITKVLDAEPGDYIVTARKAKGRAAWYIGGVTDENERDITIDFSALEGDNICSQSASVATRQAALAANAGKFGMERGRSYTATIYADAPDAHCDTNPQSYVISRQEITTASKIQLHLAPGGGFAIEIK